MRILAVADEVAESLYGDTLKELRPDLVLAAGDLPFDYLENLVSRTDVPLLYVPGNHDPELKLGDSTFEGLSAKFDGSGPAGCINVDGRIEAAAGVWIAGLGGSIRYNEGPNKYTQREMRWRARKLEWRARLRRRRIDILLTPPHLYARRPARTLRIVHPNARASYHGSRAPVTDWTAAHGWLEFVSISDSST